MKNLIIVAALAIGMSGFAQKSKVLVKNDKNETEAQMNRQKMSPQERDQKQLARLTTKLALSEVQQKQIGTIFFEQTAGREKAKIERKAAYDKGVKMTPEQKAEWKKLQMANHNAMKSKIAALLTPEQKAKWEQMQERRENKREEKMEKRREIKSDN